MGGGKGENPRGACALRMEQGSLKEHSAPEVLKPCRDVPCGAAGIRRFPGGNPHKQQPHGTVGSHGRGIVHGGNGELGKRALQYPADCQAAGRDAAQRPYGKVRRTGGGNFYILPSSIHDLILLPDDGSVNAECLKEMVQEVNKSVVVQEEWLSENVYYYDCKEKKVRISNTEKK